MKKTITMSLIFLCISSIFSAKATDVIFDFESWTSDALSRPNPINVFQDPNGVVSGWGPMIQICNRPAKESPQAIQV